MSALSTMQTFSCMVSLYCEAKSLSIVKLFSNWVCSPGWPSSHTTYASASQVQGLHD